MPTAVFHAPFIKANLPGWVKHLAASNIQALHRARDPVQQFKQAFPEKFAAASPQLQKALTDSGVQRQASSQALAKALKDFKGITEFAEPLLLEAMRTQFALAPDVNKTMLYHLRKRKRADQQTLLQAALRNFEADESFDDVVGGETSALAPPGSLDEEFSTDKNYSRLSVRYHLRDKLAIKPTEFASLCRELDLGKQYQAHLSTVFETPATAPQVRQLMIASNKDTLRLQTHIARMRGEISESAYTTLQAILDGSPAPTLHGWSVAYSQLNMLGSDVSDVVIISTAARRANVLITDLVSPRAREYESLLVRSRIIVCIPGDPLEPVKEYRSFDMFLSHLAVRLRSPEYQRFFTGFLPQDEAQTFLRRLKSQLKVSRWNPNPVYPGPNYNPNTFAKGIYESVWNDKVNLHAKESFIDAEVFGHLYEKHLARVKSNAKLLAVPTAQVDHTAWINRLMHWAAWGLNVLNVAAFFVPGLGEAMMAVTVVQLGYEVYQGVEAWSVGDSEEAWAHLTSVMQNVAYMAALGAVAGRAPPILPSRFVNGMARVKMPFGKLRLWHPDLATYKSSVSLKGLKPNALGQYEIGRKTYIALDGTPYETVFDPALNQWRIKHPYNVDTYAPILRHNGHGAWRHHLERPLEWKRLVLLRRAGPHMEHFTDAQVERIAEVSGVGDDVLRAMHVDNAVPPPEFMEAARLFEADRQVDEAIEQIREGGELGGAGEFIVPLAVEMPRWPVETAIEVLSSPEPWATSMRFGAGNASRSITITRSEVAAGKLPEKILASLDETQIHHLLGREGAQPGADRLQLLKGRLADHAQGRRKSLFDSLLSEQAAPEADTKALQQSFPSLSPEAAQHVLSGASVDELSQLRSTGSVPLRMAKAIRVLLHEGSLSRAISGLYLENLASTASDRLALHSLEQMPGWSPDVRVEVRSLGISGPLVDSIGSEQASVRYYLVKGDDSFVVMNADGKALNSATRYGRNLFESLLEVLPEAWRGALGEDPSRALRQQVADYACTHRDAMSHILKREPLTGGAGRLQRGASGRIGYAASGDVAGFADAPLVARVRDIYPNIDDDGALQFIRNLRLEGYSDQQVFNLLENRRREFDGLKTVLDSWVESVAPQPSNRPGGGRRDFADRIIACWRQGLYRGIEPRSMLYLVGADALPAWEADFSHVRHVSITSSQLADGTLLSRFSSLKGLSVIVQAQSMATLAQQLPTLDHIIELGLEVNTVNVSPALTQAVQGMTQLESLNLQGNIPELDYSTLTALRYVALRGNLREWPTGLLALERLESANLSRLDIPSLPDALFSGHERLWRGLWLNYRAMEPQLFMRVFEYVYQNPAHLVDEVHVVNQYCTGRLEKVVPGDSEFAQNALADFQQEGLSGRALLARVEALEQESRDLKTSLERWESVESPLVVGERLSNAARRTLAQRLLVCWQDAQSAKVAPLDEQPYTFVRTIEDSGQRSLHGNGLPREHTLDLTGYQPLADLPVLNQISFAQIRLLKLGGARLTLPQLNEFLARFPRLRELELAGNRLTELPQALGELTQLTRLDLSGNELTITAQAQARLNRLSALERLNLSRNRVGSLNVTALTELVSLNLAGTQITAWPEGVLNLPRLGFLDLGYSAVTSIPDAAWVGHDVLLAGTVLRGCRLSPPALARVQAFAVRNGPGTPLGTMFVNPFGIERRVLAAGGTGGEPEFYPVEVAQQPDLLLPSPSAEPDLPLTSAERLQRLDSQLNTAQAVQRIDTWLALETSAEDIEAALSRWRTEHATMIQDLNAWIDRPATRGRSGWVSATDRRRAADRLLSCWRETLRDVHVSQPVAEYSVDLSGLNLGDLPALTLTFNHVAALDLSRAGLTGSTDAFLRAFPRLNRLMLNHNPLGTLSESVARMTDLTLLGINTNALTAHEPLQRIARALPRLEVLDLGANRLGFFDVTGLDRLQNLDLSRNDLSDWPTGALEAPMLTRLDLSGNHFGSVPRTAFEPQHAALMAGTDLSDNPLPAEALIRLRDYLRETGRGLGFTAAEIDRELAQFDGATSDEEAADVHPDLEPAQRQKARWFEGVAPGSEKHRMWATVMAGENTADFANILAQLRNTKDFTLDRAGLTGRVWDVLEAAYADLTLRERLKSIARASRHNVTCGDGRILLFNELEVEVYEFNALRNIDPTDKGRALLELSKGLFRLDQLETIARERIRLNPHTDPAEIRLAYRIGLAERLALPRQPKSMIYQTLSRVEQADLDTACKTILELERAPVFTEQLIARPYWKEYLQEKYPDDFARLQQALERQASALEDQYPDFNPEYFQKLEALQKANLGERQTLMKQLSAREIAALGS